MMIFKLFHTEFIILSRERSTESFRVSTLDGLELEYY
jgi:hypothetical protein